MPTVGDTQHQQEIDKAMLAGMLLLTQEYKRSKSNNEKFRPTYDTFAGLIGRSQSMYLLLMCLLKY